VLRRFRPARTARVALASGQPVSSPPRAFAAKFWNSPDLAHFGDWWTTNPWARDEWDIALSDGALYRIYCEPRGWFVEGSYD